MKPIHANDETNLTEIELLADGRIYLFGASREVLEILDAIQLGRDPVVSLRLEQYEQARLDQRSTELKQPPETACNPRSRCP